MLLQDDDVTAGRAALNQSVVDISEYNRPRNGGDQLGGQPLPSVPFRQRNGEHDEVFVARRYDLPSLCAVLTRLRRTIARSQLI